MKQKYPIILINFKDYKRASGEKALEFARMCDSLYRTHPGIIIAPNHLDIAPVRKRVAVPVFAQGYDHECFGSHTGKISLESLKGVGVDGVLLNHSEAQESEYKILQKIKELHKHKMKSIVCVHTLKQAEIFLKAKADYIAYEPAELIGGEVSVIEKKIQTVRKYHKLAGEKLLVGAGISSVKDFQKILQEGISGILISSHVIKSRDPKTFLQRLLSILD